MSLKKIEQTRGDKGFKPCDLIIYAVIAVAVTVLFIIFFKGDGSALVGVEIYYDNAVICAYDFDKGELEIKNSAYISVEEESESQLKLRFALDENQPHSDYNDILIDKTKRSVTVSDTDCSQRKDCYYMADIVDSNGAIFCTPHRLKILPIGYNAEDDDTLIIG